MSSRLRVITTGIIGSMPTAGLVSHYLQYVLGLRALGHDVLYLEDSGWSYDPWGQVYRDAWSRPEVAADARPESVLAEMMRAHGLDDCWVYVDLDGKRHGRAAGSLDGFLGSAELFLNISGATQMREEYLVVPHRAYVDTDPGYVQFRGAAAGADADRAHLGAHTVHFSFGVRVGQPGCPVPDLGLTWHPTVQPTVAELWPRAAAPAPGAALTTVLKWNPYATVHHDGVEYGMKDVEFLRFVDAPARSGLPLEIAMEGPSPLSPEELARHGWRVRDALEVTRDLECYRGYVHGSAGEFTVAKQGYVATRSGWFSERSAAYLSSGRPVITQSTGFESWLPTGEGLLSFSDDAQLQSAFDELAAEPERHAVAAHDLAREYFDAKRVLHDLVTVAMSDHGSG